MFAERSRLWCRQAGGHVAVALVAALVVAGCATQVPLAPRPSVKLVPHPTESPAGGSLEELQETYTVSPRRNPDGFGVFTAVWAQSYLTLVPWELERLRQERARVAFARTAEEQARVVAEREAFFRDHLVFEGVWLGDRAEPLNPVFYLPEGLYLLDDRGRKFLPLSAGVIAPQTTSSEPTSFGTALEAYQYGARVDTSQFGTARHSRPVIVFPGEAVDAATRAISLYVATPERRMRFTWVFDPTYEVPGGAGPMQRRPLPGR